MHDLVSFLKANSTHVFKEELLNIISKLCGISIITINTNALMTKVHGQKIKYSKLRGQAREVYCNETFVIPVRTISNVSSSVANTELETYKSVSESLGKELPLSRMQAEVLKKRHVWRCE